MIARTLDTTRNRAIGSTNGHEPAERKAQTMTQPSRGAEGATPARFTSARVEGSFATTAGGIREERATA